MKFKPFRHRRFAAAPLLASSALFALAGQSASAANLYWNNSTPNWDGGALTWDVAADLSSVNQPWADGNDANFQTAGGSTVTIVGPTGPIATSISASSPGASAWVITGGTIQLAGAGTIAAAANNTLTIHSAISGAAPGQTLNFTAGGSVTVNGAIGANITNLVSNTNLTLTSVNNTYSGVTTVNSGTLLASSDFALGSALGGTVVGNAGAASTATLQLGNVHIGVEALTINGKGVATGTGNRGALATAGVGTSSSYAGAITAASDATISANGGTLTLTGGISKNGVNLTLGGLTGTNAFGTINVNSSITGAAPNSDLIVDSATSNLNAGNTYNGQTFIRSTALAGTGILNANANGALPTAPRSAVTMDDSGLGSSQLNLTGGFNQAIASLTGAASSVVNLNINTLTIGSAVGTTTFAGVINGPLGGIIKDGASTQILSGANNYIGATVVQAGTLQVGNGTTGNLNGASAVMVNPGAFLDLKLGNGQTFTNNVTNNGTMRGTNTGGTAVTQTVSGVITGIGNFIQNGGATTVFTNVNTYQGGTTTTGANSQLTLGTIAAAGTAGNGVIGIDTGGTLKLVNVAGNVLANNISNGVGGIGTVVGSLALPTTLTGAITDGAAGTIALTQNGPGALILANTGNTYTGANTVTGGTLQIGTAVTAGSLGSAAVVIGTGGTLSIVNIGGPVVNTFANNVTGAAVAGVGTLNVNSANTNLLTGILSDGVPGTLNLTQTGLGTTIIANNNTYSGGTTISAGVLQVGNGAAAGSLGTGAVLNNATLNFNRSDANTFANVINGSGVVNKNLANALTLSGPNTYAGLTNINGGTLILGNATALGSTVAGTNVALGATLDLNGQTVGAEALNIQGTGVGGNGALVNNAPGAASLSGNINMVGDTTVGGTGAMTLSGVVGGNFSLTKTDANVVTLTGPNNHGGITHINAGILEAGSTTALGTIAGGTVVATGATLRLLNGVSIGLEALTLNGTGVGGIGALTQTAGATSTYGGPITVATNSSISANGGTLNLTGPINKADVSLILNGGGTINVNGAITGNAAGFNDDLIVDGVTTNLNVPNSYLGPTFIRNGGVINANAANALPTLSGRTSITIDGAGASSLVLNGFNQAIASLNSALLSSTVNLNGNTLMIGFGTGLNTNGTAGANFAGVISGTGGITKDDISTQILSGTNTFTGPVNVNGGILSLQNGAAIADSVAVTVTTPGVLNLINSETIGSLAGNGNTTLNANTLTTGGNNGSTVYSGVMSGNGINSLIKEGTGTFTLSGANTFTGTATVNNGILQLQNGAALADVVAVTLNAPGALNLLNSETIGSLAGNGNTTLNANTLTTGGNNGSTTYSGVMSGNGIDSLIKEGTGTFTLSGANSFTGTATVNNGILQLQNGAALADVVAVTLNAPGALNLLNSETIGSLAGNGNTTLNANTLTTGGNNSSTTYSGVMSGNGINSLIKEGTGTFTLNGANTFTGTATVNNGILQLQNGAALADVVAVTLNAPGGLDLLNSETIGSLAGTGNTTLNANTLTTGGNNSSTTYSGVMSGNGINSLIKEGTGTFTLNGANSFTGTATVDNGILQLQNGAALADVVAVTLNAPGGLDLLNNETIGSLAGNGNTTLNANTLTTGGNNSSTTYSGVMSGNGINSLIKEGTGTFTLSGTNTFTGTATVNNGILQLQNGAALNDVVAVTLNAPGALDLLNSETIGSLAGNGNTTLNANTLTTGGNNDSTTYGGVISGTGNLTKEGTGTFILNGINTFRGWTVVADGTLVIGDNNSTHANAQVGGDVDVWGGTLAGHGIIRGNLNNYVGTVAPGFNGFGTLHVMGNYQGGWDDTSGILAIQLDGLAGHGVIADQLEVAGTAFLEGTTLRLDKFTNELECGDQALVIKAGTYNGQVDLFDISQFNDLMLFDNGTGIVYGVGVDQSENLSDLEGLNRNQKAVAKALSNDVLNPDHFIDHTQPLDAAFLAVISDCELAGKRLDQLSPESYAGFVDYGMQVTRNYTRTAMGMPGQGVPAAPVQPPMTDAKGGTVSAKGGTQPAAAPAFAPGLTTVFAGYSHYDVNSSSSNNGGDYDISSNGGIAGVRHTINNFTFGGFIGIDSGDVSSDYMSANVDGWLLGGFVSYLANAEHNIILDGGVTYGNYSFDGHRNALGGKVSFDGGDTDVFDIFASVRGDIYKTDKLRLSPMVSVHYLNSSVDSIRESGGGTALDVDSMDENAVLAEITFNAEYKVSSNITLLGNVGYTHNFSDSSREVSANFISGGSPFSVNAPGLGEDFFSAGLGVIWNVTDSFSVGANYRAEFGADTDMSNSVGVGVSYSF